jgi:hypothetical protein
MTRLRQQMYAYLLNMQKCGEHGQWEFMLHNCAGIFNIKTLESWREA